MIECRNCHKQMGLVEVADPTSYRGEPLATCVRCAETAVASLRSVQRTHRLNARDPSNAIRLADARAKQGFHPDALAVVETWALCEVCVGYLRTHRVVRMKADGRRLRLLETDNGHPPSHQQCDACARRVAKANGVLRIAR